MASARPKGRQWRGPSCGARPRSKSLEDLQGQRPTTGKSFSRPAGLGRFGDMNHQYEFDALQSPGDGEQDHGLVPSRSMDLNNDPRFFNDNVLDKRLAAFTALSVVSSVMVDTAASNFIPFEETKFLFDSSWDAFRSCVALFGFGLMCAVFLLNVVATMVFGVQFYYVYRLMTAGQIGFESARSFYLDEQMVWWRQLSVKGLIWGMPLFVLSVGCLLITKVHGPVVRVNLVLIVGMLILFLGFALFVYKIARSNEFLFRQKYYAGSHSMGHLLLDLESRGRG